jgi:tripartite-type tricarboxylate transporter receptor subunit TctC
LRALFSALKSPALIEKFKTKGLAVKPSTPAEFGAFLKSEIALWGEMIRDAKIPAQE